jgi:endonuclease/exonuclease/phosphatase family metal-dependent hydrolase
MAGADEPASGIARGGIDGPMPSDTSPAPDLKTDLRLVSWNIHRGRGRDGHIDPQRTAEVLVRDVCRGAPHVLCLQEADEEVPPHRGVLDVARVERETGLSLAHRGAGTRWGDESHGFLGVVLFLAPSVRLDDLVLLDLPGHCHRGAVVADITHDGRRVRLVGTHLSLSQALRVTQMRTIGQHLFRRTRCPTVLMGDLNEWRPWGGLALSETVLGLRLAGPAPATFPASRPFLPLDRILASAPGRVRGTRVIDSPGIQAASDHRPIAAGIAFDAG